MGISRRAIASIGALALAWSVATSARAAGPRPTTRLAADTLTAMPAAALKAPLRTHVTSRGRLASEGPAWSAFTAAAGGTWDASYDAATGVPTRIWGSGLAAPGAVKSALVAESIARYVIATHLELLAPGAAASDFVLVANRVDAGLRSVGFVQQVGGRAVVGGQIGFEFKNDRLFVISSGALPNVAIVEPRARLAGAALHDRAAASLQHDLALPTAPVTAPGAEVVLPLVADGAVLGYRLVAPLTIDGGAAGRYLAYADPTTGAVLAVHQQNLYDNSGTVVYRGINRYPTKGRIDRPAPTVGVTVGGVSQTTTTAGVVTWTASGAQVVVPSVVGDLVAIVNKGSGGLDEPSLTLNPGDQVLWDASAVVEDDAQLNLYADTNIVKAFVAGFAPDMPTLGDQLTVFANIDDACNSFFDGTAINMFHGTAMCQNTGLVQDVVFHEFGHDLHVNEIIPGVGAFDGAMSEGAADTLAVNITEDSGLGRGFFYTDEPLRELNPPAAMIAQWPRDIGEIHKTGLIFGESFWALRTAAIAQYGHDAGEALTLRLYIGALQRSTDIPTSVIEVLATDDDDGDLSNGTPNECMIRAAFGEHGLRTVSGTIEAPGALAVPAAAITVGIQLDGLTSRCPADALASAQVSWLPGVLGAPAAGAVAATPTTGTPQFYAQLPLVDHDSVLYQAVTTFADTTQFTLPDNFADPYYQLYEGNTVALYCTDFESGDPFAAGWTTATSDGSPSPWSWGVPTSAGATDPHAAFSGTHILAQALGGDYLPSSDSYVTLPPVDVGTYSDVRLQYRRWLAVEDSHFDRATISANNVQAWINATDNGGDDSDLQHIDREWRFHDVPLSTLFSERMLSVTFELASDEGLEFGGWALDDVCIVANPASVCGDGVKSATEQCDNGSANSEAADACRPTCRTATCGDGVVDTGEQCDGGPGGNGQCSAACEKLDVPVSGGCDASGAGAGGADAGAWLVVLAIGGVVVGGRRRRIA